jgi:hypothetical protein
MSRSVGPLTGSPLDRLLRSDLNHLLDRIAASPGIGTAVAALDPEARARTEEAEARLAAVRLRLLAGYEEWGRALEECGDLCPLSAWGCVAAESAPDRRAA